jgi:flavin-dependent dehydrogenase
LPPWTPFVEVHFSPGAEAYITPAGSTRIGVAFLWDTARIPDTVTFDTLLARFPLLRARLAGAPADSTVRGAGPFERRARRPIADRFVLLGDAAGYIDAITGEGLSLALTSAAALGALLPTALAAGATTASLIPYERAYRRAYRRYALLSRAVLHLAQRPALRRRVVHYLSGRPWLFDALLRAVIESPDEQTR